MKNPIKNEIYYLKLQFNYYWHVCVILSQKNIKIIQLKVI